MECKCKKLVEENIFPLPLVVGVTGHRDLCVEDHISLEKAVGEVFDDLQRRYPKTPLLLLSSLAEGADRLVTWVALEKGVRLIVPLPMHQELYEKDFKTTASLAEFHSLLQQAERCFAWPLPPGTREENLSVGLSDCHTSA